MEEVNQKRQLAAIMFTDIVGYTFLMGSDERKAMELVRISKNIQKPLVEQHNGTWLKELGDGAMASFTTASDAIYCALDIQKTLSNIPDLELRIGIHLGEIILEDGDIYGDGVNIASRLQSIADPGGIYISDSVQKAIRGKSDIQYVMLGELELKNVDYRVKTYALRGKYLTQPKKTEEKHLSGRLCAELKRRNVHRATITYLALGFIVLSISQLLELSPFVNTAIIPLLVTGLFVSIYLAWNYEKSPQGFVKVSSRKAWESSFSDYQKKPLTSNAVIIVLLLIIVGINIIPKLIAKNSDLQVSQAGIAIAVMPFRNDSEDADNLYFCNGLMEDVINQLAQIEEIRVPSVTSMLYYRLNPKPYSEIIHELQVSHLLEASVRKLDDRALMTVTLIDADKNEQIWSDRYEMDLSVKEVWEVQFEVASEIIKSLKLALTAPSRAEEEIPTGNFEAYDSYFKARELMRSWDIDQNRNAINMLRHAINLDTDFQFAYASLAQAYGQRAELSTGPWVDSAKFFANVALEMDSGNAKTMIAMGYSYTLGGDPAEGLKWYDRAYELNPKAQYLYNGWCHNQLGNYEEAMKWAIYNIENDPKNSIYYIDMCNATNALGLFEVTKNYAYKALEINPGFSFAYHVLRDVEFNQGSYSNALRFADSVIYYSNSTSEILMKGIIYYKLDSLDQAHYYLDAGLSQSLPANEDDSQKREYYFALAYKAIIMMVSGDSTGGWSLLKATVEDIENNLNSNHPDKSYILAGCYASLGMIEKGIEHFSKSVEAGYSNIYDARQNALLDPLRGNPGFQDIMKLLEEKNVRMRENVLEKGYVD